jgi:uncharacterized protein YjbI with pentapeptide repeats
MRLPSLACLSATTFIKLLRTLTNAISSSNHFPLAQAIANLGGESMTNATMANADMTNADMHIANMVNADMLTQTCFRNADMANADMICAMQT